MTTHKIFCCNTNISIAEDDLNRNIIFLKSKIVRSWFAVPLLTSLFFPLLALFIWNLHVFWQYWGSDDDGTLAGDDDKWWHFKQIAAFISKQKTNPKTHYLKVRYTCMLYLGVEIGRRYLCKEILNFFTPMASRFF